MQYSELMLETESGWTVLNLDDSRIQQNSLLVHVAGYDSPEASAALNGCEIFVPRAALPDLAEGDYYWHQLQGLQVINEQDQVLGTVDRLLETGANDVLVIRPDANSIDERERLVPYVRDRVIREVDLANQVIRVDWDADFLA